MIEMILVICWFVETLVSLPLESKLQRKTPAVPFKTPVTGTESMLNKQAFHE